MLTLLKKALKFKGKKSNKTRILCFFGKHLLPSHIFNTKKEIIMFFQLCTLYHSKLHCLQLLYIMCIVKISCAQGTQEIRYFSAAVCMLDGELKKRRSCKKDLRKFVHIIHSISKHVVPLSCGNTQKREIRNLIKLCKFRKSVAAAHQRHEPEKNTIKSILNSSKIKIKKFLSFFP